MGFKVPGLICLGVMLTACTGTTFEARTLDDRTIAKGWVGCPFGRICKVAKLEIETADGRACEGAGWIKNAQPADLSARCNDGSTWKMQIPKLSFRMPIAARIDGQDGLVTFY